ncbi:hypothetical protein PlfCFBP13513_03410 [Plantibacter flavus]|nr:hypothetical protein PlfCFBP13513_03410 [Plantibacter flavus]
MAYGTVGRGTFAFELKYVDAAVLLDYLHEQALEEGHQQVSSHTVGGNLVEASGLLEQFEICHGFLGSVRQTVLTHAKFLG